jgi:hypothetical protein
MGERKKESVFDSTPPQDLLWILLDSLVTRRFPLCLGNQKLGRKIFGRAKRKL